MRLIQFNGPTALAIGFLAYIKQPSNIMQAAMYFIFHRVAEKVVAMGLRITAGAGRVVAVLVVLVAAYGVHGQNSPYACWGGCYNQCLSSSGGTQPDIISCYNQCLGSCFTQTVNDFNYYCQIGCSFKNCIPVSYDGARLESCFGRCTNLCNAIQAP